METHRPEVIPGERIFLSHVRPEDQPNLARWFADLELTAYLGQPGKSYTYEQEASWYRSYAESGETKTFGIVVRDGEQLIGTVSLMDITASGAATLGIAIGEKTAWGKGYGSEAVRLICDYGFTFLSLYAINLTYVAFNERGHRAYLKAGFREAGRLRGNRLVNGVRYDTVLMDITRDEFGPSGLIRLIGQIDA